MSGCPAKQERSTLYGANSLHRPVLKIQLIRNSGQLMVAKDTPVLHDGNMNVRNALRWLAVALRMGVIFVVSFILHWHRLGVFLLLYSKKTRTYG